MAGDAPPGITAAQWRTLALLALLVTMAVGVTSLSRGWLTWQPRETSEKIQEELRADIRKCNERIDAVVFKQQTDKDTLHAQIHSMDITLNRHDVAIGKIPTVSQPQNNGPR